MKLCLHCQTPLDPRKENYRRNRYCNDACFKATLRAVPDDGRFWPKVQKGDGCWLWTAVVNDDGYGHFTRQSGREVYAHRFSYELHKGQIPKGMSVMHLCDKPRCVNPEHLKLGTHRENMVDARLKGRAWSKLTADQVREIRTLFGTLSGAEIARRYGVSDTQISGIKRGHKWTHTK